MLNKHIQIEIAIKYLKEMDETGVVDPTTIADAIELLLEYLDLQG